MWWLYFAEAEHMRSTEVRHVFAWGYGHFLVFAAAAAAGAGLGVLIDEAGQHAEGSGHHLGPLAVSIPVGLYVFGVWLVRDRMLLKGSHELVLLTFAVAIGLSGLLPFAPVSTAVALVLCVAIRIRHERAAAP